MATEGKRLMVLGAGPFQLPLIKRAVELGCHVITLDYLPDNVGHRHSHQCVNVSTAETAEVVAAAGKVGIDGVVTFGSDVATGALAAVADALGLPGPPPFAAATMSNKARFRRFQADAGLPAPRFVVAEDPRRLAPRVGRLIPPVVVKPVDASGSRGITRLEEPTGPELEEAFHRARCFSRSAAVCIEELLDGCDVSGDGLLVGGKLVGCRITQKHKRDFKVTGHCLPTTISQEDQQRAIAEVERTCRCLGYASGPLDFDVAVGQERVAIVEMSPRLGGNGIPQLIARATGFDLIGSAIRYALGQTPPARPPLEPLRRCGSLIFGSPREGVLRHVAGAEQVRADHPEVFDFYCGFAPGDTVPQFSHGGACMGYALFDLPREVDYAQKARAIERSLAIDVRGAVEPAKRLVDNPA